ncbi:GRAM domain-containing protein [Verrucosispora sp. WMMD573]|uniref:GRAM domain-containing protein n=1 Tax=Verrucosispora sp. WMMD573 TaxID=3015149 RepID=UPI00248C8F39|nr:GRAM domain-containing protein [Verrucosispora sp. WMMD573]WBB52452.1 GRAM domain-containing protein [Verrucosispora sp. WMMD573]
MSDAELLISRRANLWRGVESVGGRLTLTDQHLSFRAHALNVQTAPLNIPLQDIVATRKYRNLGLVPNGLAVTTRSGAEYRFVVGKRSYFVDKIAELTPR